MDVMHRLAFFVLLLPGVAFAGGPWVFSEARKAITHNCSGDPHTTVTGHENTIIFIGSCGLISVTGNKNKVTIARAQVVAVGGNKNTVNIDATDEIFADGNQNTVTWKAGRNHKQPSVRDSGTKNKISQQQ
jgi:hypothetical protein